MFNEENTKFKLNLDSDLHNDLACSFIPMCDLLLK